MEKQSQAKISAFLERIQLTDEEIQNIYKEHNWFIFSHELFRLQVVAQAATNKVLNDPNLALIEYYYHKDPDEDTGVRRMRVIPLAEAIKEAQE